MSLNILLVNPNTYKHPPVIPIGLEYLSTALEKHGYSADFLDLCFTESPVNELNKKLEEKSYDIVGFTIRNIDSALYFNNEFFIPPFRELTQCVKKHGITVVLGGSGFSAMPLEILEYLNADYGIIGPGEIIFPRFLKEFQSKQALKKIYDGWESVTDPELIHLRGKRFNYAQYIAEDGIVGIQTHVGCPNSCPYCIEANTKVSFKKIPNIIEEMEHLINQGYSHFHTCDSEFNCNLNYSIKFCKALIEKELDLKWALYMKPYPYSEELFQLLHESNANLITLSVDSDKRIQASNNYSYEDVAKIIELCKKYEIEIAIDVLTGYPSESLESTKEMIAFFKKNIPKTVGVTFIYRVLKNTSLAKLIKENISLQKYLMKPYNKEEKFLEPNFYTQYEIEIIEELIKNDDLFQIAGKMLGVNYQL